MTGAPSSLTPDELGQVAQANASGKPPVVFVHGLCLLASSWEPWRDYFEANGYSAVAPGWPDEPLTVVEGRRRPELFAGTTIGQVAEHVRAVIEGLSMKPAIIGHSMGGLVAQQLAGQGLASATVPIDPAPFRGVLALPLSALKFFSAVLRNPSNRHRPLILSYDQFRYGFANAVDENEARRLYDEFTVPGSGAPIFQSAFANLNPWTEAKVDTLNPLRGPMKFISGELDHAVPWAMTNGAFKRQRRGFGVTEIEEIPKRGHSLVLDRGWEEVAEVAKVFIDEAGRRGSVAKEPDPEGE